MTAGTRVLRFFFFNDTATTEIYTLSLHDALPILANSVIEEEMEPLNGHVDRVPVSTTTDTLLHH